MKVAFVVYPDFTALDLVGPHEIISRWPGGRGPLRRELVGAGSLRSRPDRDPTGTPASLPDPDLIVVPGSENPAAGVAPSA